MFAFEMKMPRYNVGEDGLATLEGNRNTKERESIVFRIWKCSSSAADDVGSGTPIRLSVSFHFYVQSSNITRITISFHSTNYVHFMWISPLLNSQKACMLRERYRRVNSQDLQ